MTNILHLAIAFIKNFHSPDLQQVGILLSIANYNVRSFQKLAH